MPDRFETLADLHRAGANLWIQCRDCGHISTIMTWVLDGRQGVAGQFNESMETKAIADIAARLRCSICDSREIDWTPMVSPYR